MLGSTSSLLEDLNERATRALSAAVVTRIHPLGLDRPIVSFTFDDIPVSAATVGAAMLEQHGVRGTFYVCGAQAGQVWDIYPLAGLDLVGDLARRGHEIGCHTANHRRPGQISRAAYLADVHCNADELGPTLDGRRLQTFAYPYGIVRLDLKLAIQKHFRACRGIHGGLNARRLDLGRLRADPLESATTDEVGIDRLLDETVRRRGWRVFYSHDVDASPTRVGVTPKLLAHALVGALRRGCAVQTVAATLDGAGIP